MSSPAAALAPLPTTRSSLTTAVESLEVVMGAAFLLRGARSVQAFRLERFPALQLLQQQAVDLDVAALVLAYGVGRLAVVIGAGHFFRELLLLGFQRLDLARQGFELAGFLVGELGAGLFFCKRGLLRTSFFLLNRPLAQGVAVAAGVFLPRSVSFGGDGLRDHVVEEGSVVGDEEDGAGVILQRGLE